MDLAGSERVAKTGATAEQLKVIHLILLPITSLSASIKLYDNQWLFFVINIYCAVIQLALVNSLVNSLDNYQPLSVYLSVLYHIEGEKKNFFEVKKKSDFKFVQQVTKKIVRFIEHILIWNLTGSYVHQQVSVCPWGRHLGPE